MADKESTKILNDDIRLYNNSKELDLLLTYLENTIDNKFSNTPQTDITRNNIMEECDILHSIPQSIIDSISIETSTEQINDSKYIDITEQNIFPFTECDLNIIDNISTELFSNFTDISNNITLSETMKSTDNITLSEAVKSTDNINSSDNKKTYDDFIIRNKKNKISKKYKKLVSKLSVKGEEYIRPTILKRLELVSQYYTINQTHLNYEYKETHTCTIRNKQVRRTDIMDRTSIDCLIKPLDKAVLCCAPNHATICNNKRCLSQRLHIILDFIESNQLITTTRNNTLINNICRCGNYTYLKRFYDCTCTRQTIKFKISIDTIIEYFYNDNKHISCNAKIPFSPIFIDYLQQIIFFKREICDKLNYQLETFDWTILFDLIKKCYTCASMCISFICMIQHKHLYIDFEHYKLYYSHEQQECGLRTPTCNNNKSISKYCYVYKFIDNKLSLSKLSDNCIEIHVPSIKRKIYYSNESLINPNIIFNYKYYSMFVVINHESSLNDLLRYMTHKKNTNCNLSDEDYKIFMSIIHFDSEYFIKLINEINIISSWNSTINLFDSCTKCGVRCFDILIKLNENILTINNNYVACNVDEEKQNEIFKYDCKLLTKSTNSIYSITWSSNDEYLII